MFIGKILDVENVLHKADLFLLTSEKESFGLSALEAMASSVPVISSNAGGLPELVKEGESGFTCDVGDINSMSAKAIKILDEKNLIIYTALIGQNEGLNRQPVFEKCKFRKICFKGF